MGKKKRRSNEGVYKVYVLPAVHADRQVLPGDVRQRVKRIISTLANQARPNNSKALRTDVASAWELRRIRLEDWRLVYAVHEEWQAIVVLAVRQRPPYNYQNLATLLAELEE